MADRAVVPTSSTQKGTFTIEEWLQRLPNIDQLAKPIPSLKRKRDPLVEMSENIMGSSTPPAKRPKGQNTTGTFQLTSGHTPRPPKSQSGENNTAGAFQFVDDRTPRPSSAQLHTTAPLMPPHDKAPVKAPGSTASASSAASSNQPSLQSDAGASAKRKRSESPVKSMASMRLAVRPINPKNVGRISDLPESFQSLARTMEGYRLGKGILPPNREVRDRKTNNPSTH